MIWFDNLRSVCTSSYYVQQLFSTNRGTNVLPVKVTGNSGKIYASAVADKEDNDAVIVKIVNTGETDTRASIKLKGMSGECTMITTMLSTSDTEPLGNVNYGADQVHSLLDCDNSLDNPTRIIPNTVETKVMCPLVSINIPAYSVAIFKFKDMQ